VQEGVGIRSIGRVRVAAKIFQNLERCMHAPASLSLLLMLSKGNLPKGYCSSDWRSQGSVVVVLAWSTRLERDGGIEMLLWHRMPMNGIANFLPCQERVGTRWC
jgi:hypothetical protein